MKKYLIIPFVAFCLATAHAQQVANPNPVRAPESNLPKFDLNFHGGSPSEFVEAINKQIKGTLNVVIPKDTEDMEIPAMKLKDVNVSQVFHALSFASMRNSAGETIDPITGLVRSAIQSYSFVPSSDAPTENSVWYFKVDRPAPQPAPPQLKTCKYYQLGSYLDQYKVEDITTAVKTGWDMLGLRGDSVPQLKFHQDTRLLVAVGEPEKLQLIDDVISELRKGPSASGAAIAVKKDQDKESRPKEKF